MDMCWRFSPHNLSGILLSCFSKPSSLTTEPRYMFSHQELQVLIKLLSANLRYSMLTVLRTVTGDGAFELKIKEKNIETGESFRFTYLLQNFFDYISNFVTRNSNGTQRSLKCESEDFCKQCLRLEVET